MKLYVSNGCGKCRVVKKILKANGVDIEKDFETINISETKEAAEMLKKEGYSTLPVFEKDGRFIIGQQQIISAVLEG